MITPPYIVWYHPVFVSCSHPTNILVFVLVGFLVDALDRQFFVYWGHIVTSIFRFCWFFLSDQSPIALSLCVFSLPPWQTAGQFRQDFEPGGYDNYPARAGSAQALGLRAGSARAVTSRRCPHSGRGEDFLSRQPDFFYGNSCNSGTESRKIVSKVGN